MPPVARIAQSVEQGIENPRVLGSIPSPGTTFRRTRLWRVFCYWGNGGQRRPLLFQRRDNVGGSFAPMLHVQLKLTE